MNFSDEESEFVETVALVPSVFEDESLVELVPKPPVTFPPTASPVLTSNLLPPSLSPSPR